MMGRDGGTDHEYGMMGRDGGTDHEYGARLL
jgi:hypothetical protein